jgi:hypothetical protein
MIRAHDLDDPDGKTLGKSQEGHIEARTGAEDCEGASGIAFFGWHLSLDHISMATESVRMRRSNDA